MADTSFIRSGEPITLDGYPAIAYARDTSGNLFGKIDDALFLHCANEAKTHIATNADINADQLHRALRDGEESLLSARTIADALVFAAAYIANDPNPSPVRAPHYRPAFLCDELKARGGLFLYKGIDARTR